MANFIYHKKGYRYEDHLQEGNSFLLGNGHIGYRGTYEEFTSKERVSLSLLGVYDRYGDAWREPVNMPNPFFTKIYVDGKEVSLLTEKPLSHEVKLDIKKALWSRKSKFQTHTISSERFLSCVNDDILAEKIIITASSDITLHLEVGLDLDIYDINGPHFKDKRVNSGDNTLIFNGLTNEGKELSLVANYAFSKGYVHYWKNRYCADLSLKKGEEVKITILASVLEQASSDTFQLSPYLNAGYDNLRDEHAKKFSDRFVHSCPDIVGKDEAEIFALSYSVYHLLILGDETRCRGIPARGVSGQVYKGANFWDTEVFMMPFYSLTNPKVARNLILYRINTLEGAKRKAKEFGYKGAFYAWESQDTGDEQCSLYNVTDPVTGEKIRTYFNEKQIHISAAIPFAIDRYISFTGDVSILNEGGRKVIEECARFFMSYATLEEDGLYHFNDVIGPDEYHERVDDNAYTNYMVRKTLQIAIKYSNDENLTKELRGFLNQIYLPKPNKDGVIEQFAGYFDKEEATIEELKARLRDPRDYWGGPTGVATPTKIIKQADVVALMILLGNEFSYEVKKANYEYYYPRTEHGSSLSYLMHALLAITLGKEEDALRMYKKTARIDLDGASKNFAGGIYIGGTHPAANAGAYMAMVYGFGGLHLEEGKITFDPRLPSCILKMTVPYYEEGQFNKKTIYNDKTFSKEER